MLNKQQNKQKIEDGRRLTTIPWTYSQHLLCSNPCPSSSERPLSILHDSISKSWFNRPVIAGRKLSFSRHSVLPTSLFWLPRWGRTGNVSTMEKEPTVMVLRSPPSLQTAIISSSIILKIKIKINIGKSWGGQRNNGNKGPCCPPRC